MHHQRLRIPTFAPPWMAIPFSVFTLTTTIVVSSFFLQGLAVPAFVASMGAAAVVMFVVPNSPLASSRAFLLGNLLSAFIGVTVQLFTPKWLWLQAPMAVGLAMLAMYRFRCLHPPGGATALTVVMGGDSFLSLGYLYLVVPVALNLLVFYFTCQIYLYYFHRYQNKQLNENFLSSFTNPIDNFTSRHPSFLFPKVSEQDIKSALKKFPTASAISEKELSQLIDQAQWIALKKQWQNHYCKDICKPVLCIEFGTTIKECWQDLRDFGRTAVVITDRLGGYLGVLDFHRLLNDFQKWDFESSLHLDEKQLSQLNTFDTVGELLIKINPIEDSANVGDCLNRLITMDTFIPVVTSKHKVVGGIFPSWFMEGNHSQIEEADLQDRG